MQFIFLPSPEIQSNVTLEESYVHGINGYLDVTPGGQTHQVQSPVVKITAHSAREIENTIRPADRRSSPLPCRPCRTIL